jgi:transposase-like protein
MKIELKEKKAEFKDLEKYIERISNIFKCEDAKNAKKRFKMFLNSIQTLPKTIASFIKRLSKYFEKAINHITHDFLPNTNNLLERFYRFSLPKPMKKRYKTDKELELQIELQKIRWTKRNVRLKS